MTEENKKTPEEAFTIMFAALMQIASWPEGKVVNSSFDEPHAATTARVALIEIGVKPPC